MSPVDPRYVEPLEKRIRLDKTFGLFGKWGKEQSFPGPAIGGRPHTLTVTVPRGLHLVDSTAETGKTPAEAAGKLRLRDGSPEPFLDLLLEDHTHHDSFLDDILFTFAEGDTGGDPERYAPVDLEGAAHSETRTEVVSDQLVVVPPAGTMPPGGWTARVVIWQYLMLQPGGTLISTHWLMDEQMVSDHGRRILDTMLATVALSPAG